MLLPPVFSVLKSSANVKAFVGTNPPRIYKHGEAPQLVDGEKKLPYVTWFVATAAPENQLSGTPSTDRMTIQVNCWHDTSAGIDLLAQAVRDAIEPVAYMTGMPIDQREPETRLYWIALQFDWYNDRDF